MAAEPKPNPALGAGDEAPNEKEVDGGTGPDPPKLKPPAAGVDPKPVEELVDPKPEDTEEKPPGAGAAAAGAPKGEGALEAEPNWKTPLDAAG